MLCLFYCCTNNIVTFIFTIYIGIMVYYGAAKFFLVASVLQQTDFSNDIRKHQKG